MKHTHFRIQNGAVVKCSPFDSLSGAIRARTKAEATALFLHRAETVLANHPRVYTLNGAWMLVWHNGNEFIAESGLLHYARFPRSMDSQCLSGHPTLEAAQADKTFAYYASADYQRVRGNQVVSLMPKRIESAKEAQRLSDAETERLAESAEADNAARERRET